MNCENCDGPLSKEDWICEKCGTLIEKEKKKKDFSSGFKLLILLLASIIVIFTVLKVNTILSYKTGMQTVKDYYDAIEQLDIDKYVSTMNTIKMDDLGIKDDKISEELKEELLNELKELKKGYSLEFGENWHKLMNIKNVDRDKEYSIFSVSFGDIDTFHIELINEDGDWNIVILY